MSYYQGDYYRGDPGFLSFLGKAAKTAVGFIPGVGPMLSKGLEAITAGGKVKPIATAAGAGVAAISAPRAIGRAIGTGVLKHPVLTGAGAAGVVGAAGVIAGRATGGKGAVALAPGGMVRMRHHRRMRVTNVKALRRAIRRAHGFAKIAKKCLSFTERRPHAGRAYFKRKTRKRM